MNVRAACLCGLWTAFAAVQAHAVVVSAPLGVFMPNAPMTQAVYDHTTTALDDGRVLFTTSTQTQLLDSDTGSFTSAAATTAPHDVAAATRLASGQVLLTGTSFPAGMAASAELYDPTLDRFTVTGQMVIPRYGHASILLPDGRVLITGGRPPGSSSTPLSTAELFDPVTGQFHTTGTQVSPRFGASITILASGDVLLSGGTDGQGHVYSTAEIYRVATGNFSATGNMGSYRVAHAASLLPDGNVLITGGFGSTTGAAVGNGTGIVLSTAELFHPDSATFTTITAAMPSGRQNHSSTALRDGTVILCGGTDDYATLVPTADVYDPATQRFTRVLAHLVVPRTSHNATTLPDGRVLLTGGQIYNTAKSQLAPTNAVEWFEPDDIFKQGFDDVLR